MERYYVTFGQSHPLRNGYIEIIAKSDTLAERKAHEVFGPHFSFVRRYNKEDQEKFFPKGRYGEVIIADNF